MSLAQCIRPHQAASPSPGGGPERLRWLIRRIAANDRGAFAELIDRCSGPLSRRLRHQVSDPGQVPGIVAGTFVEVWWLAGGHVDADNDVMAWIDGIVSRRVADSRAAAPSTANGAAPTREPVTALRAQYVEVELAGLLRTSTRRRSG